jgi:hypothetical protein
MFRSFTSADGALGSEAGTINPPGMGDGRGRCGRNARCSRTGGINGPRRDGPNHVGHLQREISAERARIDDELKIMQSSHETTGTVMQTLLGTRRVCYRQTKTIRGPCSNLVIFYYHVGMLGMCPTAILHECYI